MRGWWVLLAMGAALAQPVPVINGGFEDGLTGWSLIKPEGFAHGTVEVAGGDVHGGQRAVHVVNPAGEKVMVGLTNDKPIVLPDTARTFELHCWMKSTVAPQMVELRIASADRAGKSLSPWQEHGWRFIRPALGPMQGQWYEIVAPFGAQADWGGIYLTLWVNGAGADVRIDDLSVQVSDPSTRAVPRIGQRLPGPAGAALWWEGPLRKVFPDEAAPQGTGAGLDLAACGGESETVQLCLRPDRALSGVSASFSDLTGPGTLPASALRANWLGLVPVTKALDGWTHLGPTPDPLLPQPACDLPAGETRVLWLTLKVPRGTTQGDYRGTVKVSAPGYEASVPLRVHVYGFDLPERPYLRTISRIWQSHEGAMDAFRQDIADHRAGGSGGIGGISVKRVGDDVVVDTSGLPAAVRDNLRRFGSRVFNVPSVYLGDASGLYAKDGKWLGFTVFTPEFDRAFGSYGKQVGDAIRAAGAMPEALWQIWDEPQDAKMVGWCRHLAELVKQNAPDAKVYLTAGIKPELIDLVSIWNLPWPDTWIPERAAAARAKGAELWAYQNELYSLDVDDSALRLRAFPWRLRRYGIQGVEWWAISSWKSDPWTKPNQYEPQNGGGFFLYPTPDRKGAPIDSIRWEMYREGVEDYDLLTMYAEAEGEPAMEALVSQVALNVADVARDPRLMDTLKRRICERLEARRR